MIAITFTRDKSFQLVVIGQRVLEGNIAAGIEGEAGIDVNSTTRRIFHRQTFSPFRMPGTISRALKEGVR
jgi:hypothetical protein